MMNATFVRKISYLYIVFGSFFVLMTSSCSLNHKEKDEIIIGISYVHLSTPYMAGLDKALQAKADQMGVRLLRCGVRSDQISKQIEDIDTYIKQKVDVIIINPADENRLNEIIEKSFDAGIPTIILKTTATTKRYTCAINSNNIDAGELEMQFLADQLKGRGNIVILQGDDIIDQKDRTKGNRNILKKYSDFNLIKIQKGNWNRNTAYRIIDQLLQEGNKIDGVCAQNDDMAFGAIDAFEKNGISKSDYTVVGVDAIDSALVKVKEGKLDATVLQDSKGQGEAAIEIAVKAVNGEAFEKNYSVPFKLITKENVNEYIAK